MKNFTPLTIAILVALLATASLLIESTSRAGSGHFGNRGRKQACAKVDLRTHPLLVGLSDDGKILQLTGAAVGDDELAQLTLKIFHHVTALILRDTGATDKGLTHLSSMPLEILDLTNTRVTKAGLDSLRGLPIKRLLLSGTKVGNEDLKSLTPLPLEWLFLSGTGISDAGLDHLAQLPLKALNLNGTKITDAGLARLKPLHLERLDLEDTAVSDAGIEHLIALTDLKIVALSGTKVTESGKSKLKSNRPVLRLVERESPVQAATPGK